MTAVTTSRLMARMVILILSKYLSKSLAHSKKSVFSFSSHFEVISCQILTCSLPIAFIPEAPRKSTVFFSQELQKRNLSEKYSYCVLC